MVAIKMGVHSQPALGVGDMVVILVLVLVEVILGPILVVGVTLHRLRPI